MDLKDLILEKLLTFIILRKTNIYLYMKIIITEDQYNKFINLQRRLSDIMYEASLMIDNGDDFYWRVDFCHHFPTLKKYVDDVVSEIINQYEHPIYTIDETEDFIYNHIGYKNFFDMLMDEYGDKIKNFYIRKTKDC